MKGDCFEAKKKACSAATTIAVNSIVNKRLPTNESTAATIAKDFVKPATVARAAKKVVDERAGGAVSTSGNASKPSKEDDAENRLRKAEVEFERDAAKWKEDAVSKIVDAIKFHPHGLIIFALWNTTPLRDHQSYGRVATPNQTKAAVAFVDRFFTQDASEFVKLCAELKDVDDYDATDALKDSADLRTAVAAKLGVTLPPEPVKEEYIAAVKPPAAAAGEWIVAMRNCKTATEGRVVIGNLEAVINELQSSIKQTPTVGWVADKKYVGLGGVTDKEWKRVIGIATSLDRTTGELIESLVAQGKVIAGELLNKPTVADRAAAKGEQ